MRVILAIATAVSILTMSQAFVRAEDSTTADTAVGTTHIDKTTWVKAVVSASFFEIETSKIALEKSANEDVKAFAQEMIDDHTKAAEKLAAVLKAEGTELPPRALDPKQDEALSLLKKADGKDFDAVYVRIQRDAHTQSVSLFTSYAAAPDDAPLGAFAKETLPTLDKHLEHVKMLVEKV